MVPRRADGRHSAQRSSSLSSTFIIRILICGSVLSQLAVLRYLFSTWPILVHPDSPPTSISAIASTTAIQQNDGGGEGGKSDGASASTTAIQKNGDGEGGGGKTDGFFGGVPVTLRQGSSLPSSYVHCIGDNFESNAWMYRSCRFQNICFDRKTKEFAYLQSSREATLKHALQQNTNRQFMTVSTLHLDKHNTSVSLGPISSQTILQQQQSFQWTPKVIKHSDLTGTDYYELPSNTVWMPFDVPYSSNSIISWDIYFSLYVLLSSFGLANKIQPLLMLTQNHNLQQPIGGDTACSSVCFDVHRPSLPLFRDGSTILGGSEIGNADQDLQQSARLVCAKDAVAGIGRIADRSFHPLNSNPSRNTGVSVNLMTHNLAQGGILKGFRDSILGNVGGASSSDITPQSKGALMVSWYDKASTPDIFREQLKSINPTIKFSQLKALESSSFAETASAIALSSVLIVECCTADAALASIFLPRGSKLLLLYDPKKYGTRPQEAATQETPVWDLVTSAAYFKTHWVPIGEEGSAMKLVGLLRQDLEIQTAS